MADLHHLPKAAGPRDRYDPGNPTHVYIKSGSPEARLIREHASFLAHPAEISKLKALVRKYSGHEGMQSFLKSQLEKGREYSESVRNLNWFMERIRAAKTVLDWVKGITPGRHSFWGFLYRPPPGRRRFINDSL